MVKSLNSYRLKREVPVYKQAFPGLFDSEIKLLRLTESTYNKLMAIQDRRNAAHGLTRLGSGSLQSLGTVDEYGLQQTGYQEAKNTRYRSMEQYFEDVSPKVERVIQLRQDGEINRRHTIK